MRHYLLFSDIHIRQRKQGIVHCYWRQYMFWWYFYAKARRKSTQRGFCNTSQSCFVKFTCLCLYYRCHYRFSYWNPQDGYMMAQPAQRKVIMLIIYFRFRKDSERPGSLAVVNMKKGQTDAAWWIEYQDWNIWDWCSTCSHASIIFPIHSEIFQFSFRVIRVSVNLFLDGWVYLNLDIR